MKMIELALTHPAAAVSCAATPHKQPNSFSTARYDNKKKKSQVTETTRSDSSTYGSHDLKDYQRCREVEYDDEKYGEEAMVETTSMSSSKYKNLAQKDYQRRREIKYDNDEEYEANPTCTDSVAHTVAAFTAASHTVATHAATAHTAVT